MLNDEVLKVYQKRLSFTLIESISNKQGNCLTLTLAQRFEVGKRAAEYGVAASALGYFDKKLRIVWISQFPFCTPVPLMVASNLKFY